MSACISSPASSHDVRHGYGWAPRMFCLQRDILPDYETAQYDREVLDVMSASRVSVNTTGWVGVVSTDQVARRSSTVKETVDWQCLISSVVVSFRCVQPCGRIIKGRFMESIRWICSSISSGNRLSVHI